MDDRYTDALLDGRAFSRGTTNPMLNIKFGGQQGFGPDLREWVGNAAYVQRNVFAILMRAPRFFQSFDDSALWVECLRSLIELHPRTIEGLNRGLTVETDDTPVGGAGEVQEEFTNVTRERSQPVFTYNEKYGRPIQTFLENWITYGLMDPATKVANIGTLASGYPTDMLPDQYSMSVLFVEPDPTHRKVVKSWLSTNMFPKGTGEITGKRDLTAALTLQEISVEFTALTQVGLGVDVLAQRILDTINITNANPNQRAAFLQEIAPEVAAATQGYEPKIRDFGATAINPA